MAVWSQLGLMRQAPVCEQADSRISKSPRDSAESEKLVTIHKRPMSADGGTIERRKSRRFPVAVPIEVSWLGEAGIAVKENAVARQVNARGGFLKMSVYPDPGARVTLVNFLSAQTVEARVLAAPHAREGVANGIVVELITPNESFWGISLQAQKTTIELQNLETALQQQEIDLRLLKEYQEAVQYIRTAAATVQQLREWQLRGLNRDELHLRLAADRLRRATDVCAGAAVDLDDGRVKSESIAGRELYQAVQNLRARLRGPNEPRFDIFAGNIDRSAVWIKSAFGLAKARQRMEEIAAQIPGKYFLFSIHSHAVLAKIDTTNRFKAAGIPRRKKGFA